jgi:hypothetical protein
MLNIITATILVLVAFVAAARASEDEGCTKAPREQWMSVEQLKSKLEEQRYTVSNVEIEDDCAEAQVRDKDGKTAELYVDPATGAVVKRED